MKISKKLIIAAIGTIILGAIVSAISDIFVKPLLLHSTDVLLNIVTLGFVSIQNGLYQEIAQGFHDQVSLKIMAIAYSVVLSFPLTFLTSMFFYLHLKKIGLSYKNIVLGKGVNKKSRAFIRGFIAVYFLFFLTVSFFEIFKIKYVNRSITYYNQLFNATAPYLNEQDRINFNSQFAQIQNKGDYDDIITTLEKVVDENELSVYKK